MRMFVENIINISYRKPFNSLIYDKVTKLLKKYFFFFPGIFKTYLIRYENINNSNRYYLQLHDNGPEEVLYND